MLTYLRMGEGSAPNTATEAEDAKPTYNTASVPELTVSAALVSL